MGNPKAVRNAINRTFSAKGGVLWQNVKDNQLNESLGLSEGRFIGVYVPSIAPTAFGKYLQEF